MTKPGKLIIFSAPSGSGKTTIINKLTEEYGLEGHFSVSATSRPPRGEEIDGVHYHYLSTEEFKLRIEAGHFIEYEEVYPGLYYGTLKSEIDDNLAAGKTVLLDIDVIGALNVKKIYGAQALTIFIQPPSLHTLRTRLEQRGTDSQEKIEERLSKASFEMSHASQFDRRVTNDNLDAACWSASVIIEDFLEGVEKHILLFPGSFSPMHIGHLCMGNYLIETLPEISELWYSITPESPFKQGEVELSDDLRSRWAEHLLQHHPYMKLSLEELTLPKPNYTHSTLEHLRKKYPTYRFSLLMGMDSYNDFPRWYRAEDIKAETLLYIYPRPGYMGEGNRETGAYIIPDAPLYQVSSTKIRELLASGAELPYLLSTSTSAPLYRELIQALS